MLFRSQGGDVWPVLPQLGVPGREVLVGHLPCAVEDQYTGAGLVVVGPVHGVEPLLARRVPEVDQDVL